MTFDMTRSIKDVRIRPTGNAMAGMMGGQQ